MKDVIFTCSKAILVIIVLMKVAFVFEFPLSNKVDTFSIEIAESEMEDMEKLTSEVPDEFFSSDPFHWGQSSHAYLLTHYTHLILGAKAHIREIITPPPRA
jgi:hypothetical protein